MDTHLEVVLEDTLLLDLSLDLQLSLESALELIIFHSLCRAHTLRLHDRSVAFAKEAWPLAVRLVRVHIRNVAERRRTPVSNGAY